MDVIFDPRLPIMLDKERHLYCSLHALGEIQNKYGAFDNLPELMSGDEALKNLYWILKVFLNEGAVYTKFIETGDIEGAEEINERIAALLINPSNVSEVKSAIMKSFTISAAGDEPLEAQKDDEDADDLDIADDEEIETPPGDDEPEEKKKTKNAKAGKEK